MCSRKNEWVQYNLHLKFLTDNNSILRKGYQFGYQLDYQFGYQLDYQFGFLTFFRIDKVQRTTSLKNSVDMQSEFRHDISA
jgi:hypothetical protein